MHRSRRYRRRRPDLRANLSRTRPHKYPGRRRVGVAWPCVLHSIAHASAQREIQLLKRVRGGRGSGRPGLATPQITDVAALMQLAVDCRRPGDADKIADALSARRSRAGCYRAAPPPSFTSHLSQACSKSAVRNPCRVIQSFLPPSHRFKRRSPATVTEGPDRRR